MPNNGGWLKALKVSASCNCNYFSQYTHHPLHHHLPHHYHHHHYHKLVYHCFFLHWLINKNKQLPVEHFQNETYKGKIIFTGKLNMETLCVRYETYSIRTAEKTSFLCTFPLFDLLLFLLAFSFLFCFLSSSEWEKGNVPAFALFDLLLGCHFPAYCQQGIFA